jgi:hypothetical protein
MLLRIAIVFTLLVAASAGAVCPDVVGLFTCSNGTLEAGRAVEAWCAGTPGQPGNTQSAMSWDGATLGGEWKLWGTTVNADGAQLMWDTVNAAGSGTRSYHTTYEGGQFWLSKDGAWGDGLNDLTGSVNFCVVDVMVTYVNHAAVAATSNIHLSGAFDDCWGGCVIEYLISNATLAWTAASGLPIPADYPTLPCGAAAGEAFDMCCSQMMISCIVENEQTNWGTVKSLYR